MMKDGFKLIVNIFWW